MKNSATVATNMKHQGVSILQYIASNDPNGCINLLLEFNFPKDKLPKDLRDVNAMVKRLDYMIKKDGDKFTSRLIELHPDIDIIKNYLENKSDKGGLNSLLDLKTELKKELKAEGEKKTDKSIGLSPTAQNVLVGVGIGILGIGVVMAIAKNVK